VSPGGTGSEPEPCGLPGYEPLITHLFEEGSPYLDSDVVFGTKPDLVVAFDERPAGPTPDGGESDRSFLEAGYATMVDRSG
jgi:hydroxyquinol 1,2-dioxygenase